MERRIILLLVAVLAANIAHAQEVRRPIRVPQDAEYFEGRWFRLCFEKVPWHRAKEKCAAAGGRLAVIPDSATWEFLRPKLASMRLWIGASDERTPGAWTWIDGTPMRFAPWAAKEPNNYSGSEHWLSTFQGGWNDESKACPNVIGYICEWPGSGSVTSR